MALSFEEIDFRETPIGNLSLRRRRMPHFGDTDIYEIKLNEEFLMSSVFHEAEYQLSKLGLAPLERENLDVVVGGLGLGYTALSALEDQRVSSLVVVDYLEAVIEWHEKGLIPMGEPLVKDPRCRLLHADFFALSRNTDQSFDPDHPTQKHDAILLDIDHTPTNVLYQTNARFYTEQGLEELKQHLKPDGVFALWADGRPEEMFAKHLAQVFDQVDSHTIEFDNPISGGTSKGAVYVAKMKG